MSEKIKTEIKKELFAEAYVAHENNGTQAMLSVSPHLTPKSAANAATRLLQSEDVQERIKVLQRRVQEQIGNALNRTNALEKAIALAEQELSDPDPKIRAHAQKFLLECAKAHAGQEAKTVEHKHAHLHVPKR